MTFCTLVCMALEYVLYPSHIRISLCIPIKVFICLFAILKELQQLQNILLSFLRKENGLPKITIVSHTYCYNIILRIVTQSVYTLKNTQYVCKWLTYFSRLFQRTTNCLYLHATLTLHSSVPDVAHQHVSSYSLDFFTPSSIFLCNQINRTVRDSRYNLSL
jgi:hypothetical protein